MFPRNAVQSVPLVKKCVDSRYALCKWKLGDTLPMYGVTYARPIESKRGFEVFSDYRKYCERERDELIEREREREGAKIKCSLETVLKKM